MQEFLLVFRTNTTTNPSPPQSPEQIQTIMKPWQDWMAGIAAQNKLVDSGSRLSSKGTVIRPNNIVTDGPFVEIKEALAGFTIIKAESLEDATEMSKGCPILMYGGSVEVRPFFDGGRM